jgi:peptidyl-prolyl cis-trans isomerase SurA
LPAAPRRPDPQARSLANPDAAEAAARLTRRWQLLDWRQLMKILRLVAILALALGAGPRLHAQTTNVVDGILAVINDAVVTRYQVWDYIEQARDALVRGSAGQTEAELQRKLKGIINEGLDQLVERQLILHDFTTQGYRMPNSYLEDLVQERIRDQFYGDRVKLMKTLQAQGRTIEQFRDEVRDQAIVSFMRSKNISQEIVVSPYKIKNYYEAHQDDFKVEDEIKLRMIVLNKASMDDPNAAALGRDILAQIKQGATFEEMAKVNSQDSLRSQGGERGWVERSVLRKELADAAFALQPGQVSDVIETPESCYLIQVEEKRLAHAKPLDDVRNEIERTLVVQEQAALQKQWIERLKAKTFILYFP